MQNVYLKEVFIMLHPTSTWLPNQAALADIFDYIFQTKRAHLKAKTFLLQNTSTAC